jgi:hypothetical protein
MGGDKEMSEHTLAHVDHVIEQGREMEEIVRTDREEQEAN